MVEFRCQEWEECNADKPCDKCPIYWEDLMELQEEEEEEF